MDPSSIPEEKSEKKKRHIGLWILLVIVILIVLFFGWTGIYNIPLLTNLMGTNEPIDLGVEVSEEALASAMVNNPMDLQGSATEYSGVAKKIFTGEVPIDGENTSEELTSFLQHYTQNAPHVRDLQVKYIEGGMEISTFVKTRINAPVYVRVGVTKTGAKSVDIDLQSAKVGRLPIPSNYYDQIEEIAEEIINDRIASIESFSIDTLEYHDGYAYFKGSMPETVEVVSGEENGLLD
ncbi:hypothetical protein KKG41_01355 [Patescibacteria group bacterium]|nr:hypothetical protein [Patescibacteria group bacterium]MBU1890923.1 hypothetical protein [Patescibacteria group bacterium]